jgi:hypothetical protein
MNRTEALELLRDWDHAIVSGDGARQVAEAFGIQLGSDVGSIRDTRSEFKGAYMPDVKEGEVVHDVIGAEMLAEIICRKLGVEYRGMHGRGSQLRECVRVLTEYAKGQEVGA